MIALIAFSDLISPKTLDDWKTSIANMSSLVGLKITNWVEGGFARTMTALFAQLYTLGTDIVRQLAASSFLETAEGEWLKFLAREVFDVEPIEATYASAAQGITLTNTGGGQFTFEAGDVTVSNAAGTHTYHTTSGGTLASGPGHTLTLDLVADEKGSGSNAPIGTITEMVTAFLGVTCSNEVALIGLDEEDPDLLKQRCRDSAAAQSIGGIKDAYEFYARGATRPDGTSIGVTRVQVMPPPGDGTLTVYIASASGAIAPADVAIVQTIFDETVTPYGLNALAVSATNLGIAVPCTIWIPSSFGLSEADARQLVYDALAAYVIKLPIGGTIIPPDTGKIFWRAELGIIEGAIKGMLKAQLSSEVDVSVSAGQAPIWAGSLAQTTVMQVAG